MSEIVVENNPPDRRLVRVPISFPLLIELLTQGSRNMFSDRVGLAPICEQGLPADASFVGSYTDNATSCGYLVFHHSSFAPVALGAELPEFTPRFRQQPWITPFEGLMIEFPAAGEVVVRRRPDVVDATYTKPDPSQFTEEFHTEDGSRYVAQMQQYEDYLTFSSKTISLQDRVRYVRDSARVSTDESFLSVLFPITRGDNER